MEKTHRRIALATALTLAGIGIVGATADAAFAAPTSGPASASAHRPSPAAPGGRDTDGLVTATSASSLSVQDLFGTTHTYSLGSATTVHSGPGTATLTKGEHVHVRATGGGSLRAEDVDVLLAGIDGRVLSTGGSTLTVVDRDGLHRQITTSAQTRYTRNGQAADQSGITVGTVIHATGVASADGSSLDARTVDVRTADAPPAAPAPAAPAPGDPAHRAAPGDAAASAGAPSGSGAARRAPAPADQLPTPPAGGPTTGSGEHDGS